MIAALLLAALAASPGDAAYERARKLFAEQRVDESFAAVEEALTLDPKLIPALTLKARIALAVNRFGVAQQALIRAVELAPRDSYARFLLGFQYFLQNDLKAALTALEHARKLDPRDAKAPLYLAMTHESLGDNARALEFYREAVRLENAARRPQPDTLLAYARLLMLLDRFEVCRDAIDRAVALDPGRDVHYERARLKLRAGDAAGAARDAEKALALPPQGIAEKQIRYLLVRAHSLSGNQARAAEHAAALRALE